MSDDVPGDGVDFDIQPILGLPINQYISGCDDGISAKIGGH
jgi:hypothetical protein